MCWLDNERIAIWGYGDDDEWMIPAVRIFNAATGIEENWFPGPIGSLVFDHHLFAFHPKDGTSVWDISTDERILEDADLVPVAYHPGSHQFLSLLEGGRLRISTLKGGAR